VSKLRYAFISLLLAGGAIGPGAAPADAPRCTSDAVLVLDGSGSMSAADFAEGAPNRMNRVRAALARVVPDAARVRRLGLVVYGPGPEENSCRNIDVKFSPKANAAAEILRLADSIRPAGRTPLARSVEQALAVLEDSARPVEIVVLTDGEDTCGGDPCLLAKRVKAQEPGVTVHVVGFRLPTETATGGASCLARETGGLFVTAETTDDLLQALRQTLTCTAVSRQ
jgi:Ca-activated chloride channel family protein